MSSQLTTIDTGYRPRPGQAELHPLLKRFNVLVHHRRWGKTHFAVNEKVDRGLRLYTSRKLPRPRYSYIAPTYGQAKKISWDIFKAYCHPIPGVKFNEQELRVDISLFGDETDTLRFQLLGAENPDSLRGIYNDGVTVDEPAQMPPTLWAEVIRPTLLDRKGWANFIGTPKGKNEFHRLHKYAALSGDPEWFTKVIKASQSGIIPPEELASMLREMGQEAYDQEMECSFEAAIKGAYYSKILTGLEDTGKVRLVPYDPELGVMTAWDLGMNDSLVIWFVQRLYREVRVIDYLEMSDMEDGLPDVVREMQKKPYIYTTHLLPHDAAVRALNDGKSRVHTLKRLGLKGIEVLEKRSPGDGINAVKNLLPMCFFDVEKTYAGFEHLKNYRREWDDKTGVFKDRPVHDQASHAADAFRTLAMGIDRERPLVEPERRYHAITEFEGLGDSHL
jgi:phage terminase large subunit